MYEMHKVGVKPARSREAGLEVGLDSWMQLVSRD